MRALSFRTSENEQFRDRIFLYPRQYVSEVTIPICRYNMLDAFVIPYLVVTTRRAATALQYGENFEAFRAAIYEIYENIFQAKSSVVTLAILNNFTQIVFRNFLRDDAHNFPRRYHARNRLQRCRYRLVFAFC